MPQLWQAKCGGEINTPRLSEIVELPSIWEFAEGILSDTRQIYYLPSIFNATLGKPTALGKTQLCRVSNKKHPANYNETLGKVDARALGMRRPLGAPPCHYNFTEYPLETLGKAKICRVFFIDTRQTDIFAECFFWHS